MDGYRAIAVIDSTGKAQIWSRNHLPGGRETSTELWLSFEKIRRPFAEESLFSRSIYCSVRR
jgi:hypothetical protein